MLEYITTVSYTHLPEGIAQVASVIYNSLADCYKDACREIEALTGKTYDKIRIVGGGSNAEYLNELTAKASEKAVYAGTTEATAIGNIACLLYTSRYRVDYGESNEKQ